MKFFYFSARTWGFALDFASKAFPPLYQSPSTFREGLVSRQERGRASKRERQNSYMERGNDIKQRERREEFGGVTEFRTPFSTFCKRKTDCSSAELISCRKTTNWAKIAAGLSDLLSQRGIIRAIPDYLQRWARNVTRLHLLVWREYSTLLLLL